MQINSLMPSSRWDYVPVIGSGVAAVQLFERCLSTEVSEVGRHRYGVLAPGGIARAICLLLPVIGNIVIFVYDLVREGAFNRVSINGLALRDLWEGFQDDEEIVKAAVMQNEEALTYASDEVQAILRQEITEAISAVRVNGLALENLDGWLKNVRSVVTAAIEQNELTLQYASPSLQERLQVEINQKIAVVRANGLALEHLDGWLKNVGSVVTAAVGQNELALQYASPSLQAGLRAEINQKIAVVQANGLALQHLDGWLKNVRSVVTAAIEQNELALQYASPSLQERLQVEINQKIAVVRANGLALQHLEGWLKNVRSVVTAAVKHDGMVLRYASDALKHDRGVVLEAVRQDTMALRYASDALKDDRGVVLEAVRQDATVIRYASDAVKHDRDFMLEVVRLKGRVLQFVSAALKNDKGVVLEAVGQNGGALQFASDTLKDDEEVVRAAVSDYGGALQFASAALKNDRRIVLAAVEKSGWALEFASDTLKDDRGVVLVAVRQDGRALQYASAEARNDGGVVLEAVRENELALMFVSDELKHDRDFMLAAVRQDGRALKYASDALRNDEEVVLAAVRQNGCVLEHASAAFKNNKEIVLEAVKQSGWALACASDTLKDDEEVVRAAIASTSAVLQYASERVRESIDQEVQRKRAIAMCGAH